MHLFIPFASALSEGLQHALQTLALPRLAQLLALLQPGERVGIDEYTLTPPHERALADLYGWQGDDGGLPWAAVAAAADGIDIGTQAWGLMTPVHWHVGTEFVTLTDPQALALDAAESRQAFDSIRELFESEGWRLAWGAPARWYAAHDSLDALPCASLDRVVGRNVDLWLPAHPQARLIRRLQNEVQMSLYQQPLHDERVARGVLPINSFWLSGCGRAQPVRAPAGLVVDERLKTPALAGEAAAWAGAWQALDDGPVAEWLARAQRGEPISLTLCGERQAQRFNGPVDRSWWARTTSRWRSAPPARAVLEGL